MTRPRGPFQRYAAATGIVAAATVARLLLDPFWGLDLAYFTFWPAVMLAAWVGGLGAGIWATLLSALAVTVFWVPPRYTLTLGLPWRDTMGLALFVAVGAGMSLLNEALHRAREQAETSADAARRETADRRAAEAERDALFERERAARAEAEAAHERSARVATRLRTLARLSQRISASLDPTRVLTAIAEAAAELMQARLVSIWIADEVGRVLRRAAFSDEPLGLDHPHVTLRYGEGGIGVVAQTRQVIDAPDLHADDRLVARDWFRAHGLVSALELPVLLEGRLLGVLALFGYAPFPADLETRDVLDAFVTEAALAIRNARLYEEAEIRRAEAEAANRSKDEFLATLSHELRTPLNSVLGWARMLRTGTLEPDTRDRALDAIIRGAVTQSQLVGDLLDISRITAGKLRLDVRPVYPAEVVEAALDTVRPAAEARHLRLQAVLDPRAGPVSGDPDRLQQVVWNLLANAIKFTPRGGRVHVRLERVDSHVEIVVSDTGEGIAPEVLPLLFERFHQADGTSTRRHGGLGLGLALVRHLVELHGGSVEAASPGPGQGATFTVKLPLMVHVAPPPARGTHPTAAPQAAEPSVASVDARLAGIAVLVVDDDPDAVDLLSRMLARHGAEVRTVASAAEALAMLERWLPAVLVSDIEMPGEDGYSLVRHVRARPDARVRALPAVAVTAYGRMEDRVRALSAGFDLHVAKPIEPAELVAAIHRLARRRPA